LYGEFPTKDWRKNRLSKHSEKDWEKDGYLYSGSGPAFRNQEELDKFIKLYRGTIFQGVWDNSFVLWCYYEIRKEISQEEWDKLPYTERKIYKSSLHPVKIHVDDKKYILFSYYLIDK